MLIVISSYSGSSPPSAVSASNAEVRSIGDVPTTPWSAARRRASACESRSSVSWSASVGSSSGETPPAACSAPPPPAAGSRFTTTASPGRDSLEPPGHLALVAGEDHRVAADREVPAQRPADVVLGVQDPPQVGVAAEDDSEEVVDLALVELRGREQLDA